MNYRSFACMKLELLFRDNIIVGWFLFACFQERAAGALANLAADDKCSMEVALAGGVHALVMLARNCKFEGVQEQVVLHWFQHFVRRECLVLYKYL